MAEGYARPELLAETGWLAEHLDDPGVRVVDADSPEAYARAHIPGAVGLPDANIFLKTARGEPFLMGPEPFAALMDTLGIGGETAVVVYDAQSGLHAARFWWTLAYYGHPNVRVLNGGWHTWLLEGRPVTMAPPGGRPVAGQGTFTPRAEPGLLTDCPGLRAAIGRADAAILDVRSDAEWTGADARRNARRGHVPGAVHLEWVNLVTADDRRVFKPATELRGMLEALGVSPDREVSVYCQAGIRAAHATFVLKLLGYERVRNYDGSMRDWANREDTPLVVEGAR
jgi:thiosulfate/3-mercaptopyruvate sulfurtransferase